MILDLARQCGRNEANDQVADQEEYAKPAHEDINPNIRTRLNSSSPCLLLVHPCGGFFLTCRTHTLGSTAVCWTDDARGSAWIAEALPADPPCSRVMAN
eukprot:2594841-Amphidinium_carterae.1